MSEKHRLDDAELRRLGRAAYNGHRATYEADDGGPFYLLSRDEWGAGTDQVAWANAAAWVLHEALGGIPLAKVKSYLTGFADHLEDLEVTGKLDVGLPIEGTIHTAYSAAVREAADAIRPPEA